MTLENKVSLVIVLLITIVINAFIYIYPSFNDEPVQQKSDNDIIFEQFKKDMDIRYGGQPYDITSKTYYREQSIFTQDFDLSIMANERPAWVEFYVVREIVFGVFTTYWNDISHTHICFKLETENFASCEVPVKPIGE